jgi:hypothetical protein
MEWENIYYSPLKGYGNENEEEKKQEPKKKKIKMSDVFIIKKLKKKK